MSIFLIALYLCSMHVFLCPVNVQASAALHPLGGNWETLAVSLHVHHFPPKGWRAASAMYYTV